MKILVNRIHSNRDATLSNVSIDGKFQCFALEDGYREIKMPGETRIPAGTYDVTMRTMGGFDMRYRRKFSFHKGMLMLRDVPGFTNILIHIGNTDEDTSGCLLLGEGATVNGEITVQHSRLAYEKFYLTVQDACLCRKLRIEYIDNDLV